MASTDAVAVWNRALQRLGLTERVTVATSAAEGLAGRLLWEEWDATRREVLSMAKWDFSCRTFGPLAEHAGDPIDEAFTYWYTMPTYLRLLRVWDPELPVYRNEDEFELRRDGDDMVLLSNIGRLGSGPKILAVTDEEDLSKWPEMAASTLTYALAARVALQLTKDKVLKDLMEEEFTKWLIDSKSLSIRHEPEPIPHNLRVRYL